MGEISSSLSKKALLQQLNNEDFSARDCTGLARLQPLFGWVKLHERGVTNARATVTPQTLVHASEWRTGAAVDYYEAAKFCSTLHICVSENTPIPRILHYIFHSEGLA